MQMVGLVHLSEGGGVKLRVHNNISYPDHSMAYGNQARVTHGPRGDMVSYL